MSITQHKLNKLVESLKKSDVLNRAENFDIELTKSYKSISMANPYSKEGQDNRLSFISQQKNIDLPYLSGRKQFSENEHLKGNIENYIGMSQVPTGIFGPLIMNGANASGAYYVPLATSEGALVASYSRGAKACKDSGAIIASCLMDGVQRCPVFKFDNLLNLGKFVVWVMEQKEKFEEITQQTSNYAQLNELSLNIEGNVVIVTFEFTTGDAAGQNMVTICTEQICRYIMKETPFAPKNWFIESNLSGDKKATSSSFSTVRGKNVTAEITLKKEIVKKVLKSSPELMREYWQTSFMGGVKCGSIGSQGHFANGLAALFIACGQDAACVSEASVGITRMEVNDDGDLYCSATLPNLIVGTVGGGTSLPTQKECLGILDCQGKGNAKKFAEICAGVCLSGEISIIAALSAGHFSEAHQNLWR